MASFEYMAINKLLKGEVELISELALPYFTDKTQKIYKIILEYYSENSKLPSAETLKATIETRAPVAVRGGFMAMVDAICKTDDTTSSDVVVSSLKEGFVLRSVDNQIEELLDAQRNKDAGKVKGILSGLLENLSVQSVKIGDFVDAMEEDDHFTVTPTGLGEEFDELIGGGYSGVSVITAKSGHGKSILLQQAGIESFLAGKNVLYLSLELSGKVLGNRVKSYLTGIPFGTINSGKTTPSEDKLIKETLEKTFSGRKNKWRVSTSPVDTDELLNIIKVEKQLHDIDVVIIDYLALVSPSKYDRGESWATMANLVKRLHKYTMSDDVVIVTASQVNDVKKGGDGVEPTITTRGSKEIEFSATQLFYIEKVEEGQETDGESPMALYQIKNRLAKKVHSVVNGNFGCMKVADTGVRLN